jgi:eukaryotic-like serine/threonine-protein kinase
MKQEALIGRKIAGKYVIDTLVGEGAMGAVYKARQTTLGTTLALKVLHGELASDPMFAARFLREAQAASRVDHPSSMRVVDFGEESDGLLYIAMEYVDGKTLARILDDRGPLPVERIVDIACQALAALAVAHDIGVIHRDLKPENIMIITGADDEGRTHDIVKVCDFGVAKLLDGGGQAPSVTAEGLVIGTPEYMSPEQARGEALDARSDIYAMGVLLFHMMTGKVPFDSSTAFGTAFMQVNEEPTRPRLLNPRVDSRLEKICLKAMRKRREDRYSCARELRSELRALIGADDAYGDEVVAPDARNAIDEMDAPLTGGLLKQIEGKPRKTGLVMAGVVVVASLIAGKILFPHTGASSAPHESVQSATITSATLPAAARPLTASTPTEILGPTKIVDTTESDAKLAEASATSPIVKPRITAAAKSGGSRSAAKPQAPTPAKEIPALPDPAATDKPAAPAKPVAPATDPALEPLPNFPIPGE